MYRRVVTSVGAGAMPMSHGSVTGRMSTSPSPSTCACRVAHSIASSIECVRRTLKAPGSSWPRGNGPGAIVRPPPANVTRTPCELARSPSAPSSTPFRASSPRSPPTRSISAGPGLAPDSRCAFVWCMMMNRTSVPRGEAPRNQRVDDGVREHVGVDVVGLPCEPRDGSHLAPTSRSRAPRRAAWRPSCSHSRRGSAPRSRRTWRAGP